MLLLPDFERVVRAQLENPSQATRHFQDGRMLSATRNWENICCGQLPPVDQAIAPPKSILGLVGTHSRNCKMMDALLARMHRAMAVQAGLANTRAILSLYQRQLTQDLHQP